jgi:hypothetical protein
VIAVHGRHEQVGEQIFRVVVAHRDLFEHHCPLDVDVVRTTLPTQDHVTDDVDGGSEVLVEYMRVVAGLLFAGERVEFAADRVDLLRGTRRRPRRCRLEQQMLEKVRRARDRGLFVA